MVLGPEREMDTLTFIQSYAVTAQTAAVTQQVPRAARRLMTSRREDDEHGSGMASVLRTPQSLVTDFLKLSCTCQMSVHSNRHTPSNTFLH